MKLNVKSIAILMAVLLCLNVAGVPSWADDSGVPSWSAEEMLDNTVSAAQTQSGAKSYASSAIDVNGQSVEIKGHNIEGNNYFKLRDVAAALSGTEKQFQVSYNTQTYSVMIEKNQPYKPDGTESPEGELPNAIPVKTVSPVYLDGKRITLNSYNVGGYNYVKLRDVATMMDFALIYYADTKAVSFLTDKDYSQSKDVYPNNVNPDDNQADNPSETGKIEYHDLYNTEAVNVYSKYVTSLVDGFRMMVPSDMAVDMTNSELRTIFENNEMRIEVYRQDLNSAVGSFSSYVNYGNQFIKDSSIYTKVRAGYSTISGRNSYVLEWYRSPLARVTNDMCYYASVDVQISNGEILTFLFKSNSPFDTASGEKSYISMLKTLTLTDRTKAGITTKTNTITNNSWNAETKKLYNDYFSADSDFTWGIYEPTAPFSFEPLKNIENQVQGKFKFLIYYTGFTTDLPKLQTVLKNAADENRTVELTLQTANTNSGKGNMLLDVLNGNYDAFLKEYARIVADSEKPVLFRLCNEMNGDWCVYSAYHTSKDTELFVEFYKYVYNIFKENGAIANTIWVWNPNERSFPYYDWNHALCYYPGDEYANIIGLTGYNTGTYYGDETWRSFEKIYDAFYYQYDAWFSQPFMITEFACSNFGGDKAQWVRDMMTKMNQYSRIKAAIWWDGCDFDSNGHIARSYFIDDNQGVIQAYKDYFAAHPSNLQVSELINNQ